MYRKLSLLLTFIDKYLYLMSIVMIVLFIFSCSTKKNNVFSRNTHAIVTEFNIVYNGNLLLEKGDSILQYIYHDNFMNVLPIEKMEIDKELQIFENDSTIKEFRIAEDKAIKAVQKHSINIEKEEYNPQMDETFLLLGIARYYSRRFIEAQDAFNYILFNYPNSDKITLAKIWREKTNIRLYNYKFAIKNIKDILKHEILDKSNKEVLMSSLADAFYGIKQIDSTIFYLREAIKSTNDKKKKGRYLFIIGQLYEKQNLTNAAVEVYRKVAKLNFQTLRGYVIHSIINTINYTNDGGHNARKENFRTLYRLEKVFENRKYRDILEYNMGKILYENREDSLSVKHFDKAIKKSSNKLLKALAYEYIAKISFKNNDYALSGAYYDSILMFLPKYHPKHYETVKKRDFLKELINYENNVNLYDSIIGLVNMSPKARINYFEDHIRKLKKSDLERKKRELEQREKEIKLLEKINKGSFYFYNPSLVDFGKKEFKKKWGNRQLNANWRISSIQIQSSEEKELTLKEYDPTESISNKDRYNVEYYLKQIPTDEVYIDSISKILNNSYYHLGIIYSTRFKNFRLAENSLKQAITHSRDEDMILSSKYYLYKIYTENNSPNNADIIKKEILRNYPNTIYAQMVSEKTIDKSLAEKLYEDIYKLFYENDYNAVINTYNSNQDIINQNILLVKFKLLYIIAQWKVHKDDQQLINALQELIKNYSTNENKAFIEYVNILINKLKGKSSTKTDTDILETVKLVFELHDRDNNIDMYYQNMLTLIKNLGVSKDISVSKGKTKQDTDILVVHGYLSRTSAIKFQEIIKNKVQFIRNPQIFVISQKDYEYLLK